MAWNTHRLQTVIDLAPSEHVDEVLSRMALIGPFGASKDDLNGPWVIFGDKEDAVSLEQGLRAAMTRPSDLAVVRGSDVEAPIAGGIAAALATGDVGAISDADAEAMRRAGLAHLLSVSGLHITAAVAATMPRYSSIACPGWP